MATRGGGGSPLNVTDQVVIDLIARSTNFIGGLDKAGAAMNRFLGFVFSWRGAITGGLAIVAIALVKVGRASVAMAAVLDAALREVATLIPETADQIDFLRKRMVELSTRVPEAPELLSKALYQTISAGIQDTAEAFGVLEVAAQAAIAGVTTTFTSVDAITTVLNAYQLGSDEARRVSDVFFATVREGKITFDELSQSIGTVATSAALTGASIEEVGAAMATLTKFGISAETAATSLNRTLLAVVNATDDEKAAAEALGFELSAAAIQTKGLTGFINDLAEATQGEVNALAKIFPEIRAFRAVSILAGQGIGEFNRILGTTNNAAGGTADAFQDMRGSLGTLSALVKNRLNAILRDLGSNILPLVTGAMEDFLDATDDQIQKELELLDALGRVNEALDLRRQIAGEQLEEKLRELQKDLEKTTRAFGIFESLLITRAGGGLGEREEVAVINVGPAIEGMTELNDLADQFYAEVRAGNFDLDPMIRKLRTANDIVGKTIRDDEKLRAIVTEQLRLYDESLATQENIQAAVDQIRRAEQEFATELRAVTRNLLLQNTALSAQETLQNEFAKGLQGQLVGQRALLKLYGQRTDITTEEREEQAKLVKDLEQQLEIVKAADRLRTAFARSDVSIFGLGDEDVRLAFEILDTLVAGEIAIESQEVAVDGLIAKLKDANQQLLIEKAFLLDLAERRDIDQDQRLEQITRLEGKLGGLLNLFAELGAAFAGERKPLQFPKETEKSIEAARERLAKLRREIQTLERFGFKFFDEMPEKLQDAVEAVEDVDQEILDLEEDMKTAGDQAEDLKKRLEELRAEREERAAEVERVAQTTEGRISEEAAEAREEIGKLIDRRNELKRLGLDFGDASDEIIELVDAFGRLDQEIAAVEAKADELRTAQELLREQADLLSETDAERAESLRDEADALDEYIATANLKIAALRADRAEVERNAAAQRKFADSFEDLSDVTTEFLELIRKEFGPAISETFEESIERFADLQRTVQNAEANLRKVRADREASSADLKRAEDRLRVAQANLTKQTILLAIAFQRLGLSWAEAVELAEALGGALKEIEDSSEDLVKTLRQLEGLARGILGVADAFFELNDSVRQALTGVVDLASGIGQIAGGNLISGIAEAAGGIAGIIAGIGGLFGESEAERRRREALESNTIALRRLQRSMERQERITAGLTGVELGKFLQLGEGLTIGEAIADAAARGIEDSDFLSRRVQAKFLVPKRLEALGITIEELEKFADLAGISVDQLISILETGQGDFEQAADEWDKLVEAAREFDLGSLIDEFDEKMNLFEQRVRLFADAFEDPIKRLNEMQRILGESLPDNIREALTGFDLATAKGRADALAFLQDLFERGLTDPSVFGEFDPEAFRDAIVDFGEAIHDFEDSVADDGTTRAFQVSRQITEVTGNRIVGALTTISIIDQLQLAVLREILIELGGTVPENVAAISFRAPGTELDILTVEQEQLKVLQEMLAIWKGEQPSPVVSPTQEEIDLGFNPQPQTYPVPTLSPEINFAPGSVSIRTDQLPSPEASRQFIEQVVPEVDRELSRRWEAERRTQGAR